MSTDLKQTASPVVHTLAGLLGVTVLMGLGEHIGDRFVPLYLLALGATEPVIGLFQGLYNFLGAVYSYPAGLLADRIGPRRSLGVFNFAALLGYAVVIVFPNLVMVFVGAALFLFWSAMAAPASMKLVTDTVATHHRTKAVTAISLTRRIPKLLGPLVGSALVHFRGTEWGVRMAFGLAFVLTLIAIRVQQKVLGARADRVDATLPLHSTNIFRDHPWAILKGMSPSLRNLLVADTLVRFCEQVPMAFVIIWCMETITHPVSAWQFGMLTAIEQITAILLYVPVAYLADKSNKRPFVLMTFVFFSAFPVVLYFSHSFVALSAAFLVRGLKEFGEPTRKALILDLCPADRRATYFGGYYLVRDVITALAAVAGGFLWRMSPAWNLWAAAGCGLLGTLWFARYGRDAGPMHSRT